MKLSLETRWILANQYRLLEQSAGDEGMRDHYRNVATILERGYELEYGMLTERFSDPMSEEDCRELYDILTMFSDLQIAYAKVGETSGVDGAEVSFGGFDGNNEGKWMSYTHFLMTNLGKWEDLAPPRGEALTPTCPCSVSTGECSRCGGNADSSTTT